VLNELGSDFNSFVIAITTRSDLLSIEELHGFLLSHEALLNSQHQPPSSSESVAFYASGRGRGRYTRSRGRGSVNSSPLLPTPIQGQTGSYFPSGRGFYSPYNPSPGVSGQKFSPHGRASTFTPLGDKPVCQVCKKRGHETLDCWHRFDNAMYPSPPQAFFNSTISTPNEGWFLDSGASHHVTADLNNLTYFRAYDGQDRLQVGNGSHLIIQNQGHCSLSSPHGSLDLNGVLHVPYITKNLISISKLTKDNDVILEFHPLFCIVKDRHTKQPFLRALQINGLYHLKLWLESVYLLLYGTRGWSTPLLQPRIS
jgi:hypothetical protein